jgi:hypothetical protein
MTCLKYFTGLIFLLLASPVAADVITAASCSESDVRAALKAVTAATTRVNIPAGTCHWSSKMVLDLPPNIGNISILGAGNLTVTGGGDATVIIDDLQDTSDALWAISANSANVVRIAGLTIRQGTGVIKPGFIRFVGSSQLRVDHNTFQWVTQDYYSMYIYLATGVFDHNIANYGPEISFSGLVGPLDDYNGARQWSEPTAFGSSNFFFVEDNVLTVSSDCQRGAKLVVRYNTLRNGVNSHGTGSPYTGELRGCRALEIYGNTFTAQLSTFNAAFITSGPVLAWGNTVAPDYGAFMTLHTLRRSNQYVSNTLPTPNGYGLCGTSLTGTGSNWDQNSVTSSGYACLDQPGRGQGDRLSGAFPKIINTATGCDSSQPCAWPRQALEPIYEWLNTLGPSTQRYTPYEPDVLQANRDYYAYATSFTGASGVGSGVLANRPATCTPKVAYWATDTKTLYQCASANTWTIYYRPYMYPHPLAGGSEASPLSTSLAPTPSSAATATPAPTVLSAGVSTTPPTPKSTGGQPAAATPLSIMTPVSSAEAASPSTTDVRPTAAIFPTASVTSPQGVGAQPNPVTAPKREATVPPTPTTTPPATTDARMTEPIRPESPPLRVAAIPPSATATRPTEITPGPPAAAGTAPQIVLGSPGPRRNRALPVTVTSEIQLAHVKVFIDDKLVLTLATTAMKLTFSQSLPNRKAVMVRVEATDAGGHRATQRVAIPPANDIHSVAGDHGRSKASKPPAKESKPQRTLQENLGTRS